jgi:hypothetical protein
LLVNVRVLYPILVKLPAVIVVNGVRLPLICIVAVAVLEAILEYPDAENRMHEYGIINPLEIVFNEVLRVVDANRVDGKLYCKTLPIPETFPPKLIENPPIPK